MVFLLLGEVPCSPLCTPAKFFGDQLGLKKNRNAILVAIIHTHTHTHTHIYIHTHIHTYIHTYTSSSTYIERAVPITTTPHFLVPIIVLQV